MSVNSFAPKKFEDTEIVRIVDGKRVKVGSIRVKPSGILWSPKGAHQWYGVSLPVFAEFMKNNGKLQQK